MKAIRKKAQVALELATAMVGIILLLYGAVAIFMWANNRLIVRQEDYEGSSDYGRVKAAGEEVSEEVQVDESEYPELDILNVSGTPK